VDDAQSRTREVYRGAFRDINGDSPFTDPPLKIVQVRLHVPEKQHRLVGSGCVGSVDRGEGQINVVEG
jgi:hypothetical protein